MKKREIFGSIQRDDISKDENEELISPYNQQIQFYNSLVKWSSHAVDIIKDSGCYEGRLVTYADHITIDDTLEKHSLTWFNGGTDESLPDEVRAALEVLNAIHEVYIAIWERDKLRLANASIELGIIVSKADFLKKFTMSAKMQASHAAIERHKNGYTASKEKVKDHWHKNIESSLSAPKAADQLKKIFPGLSHRKLQEYVREAKKQE